MAGKREFPWVGEWVREIDSLSDKILQPERVDVEYPSTVRLRLMYPVRYITEGSVSGNRYEFDGAGNEQDVDEWDAPALLEKKQKTSCCAGTPPPAVFQLVEGN